MSDIRARYEGAMMNTFGVPKVALVRGQGAHVWDEDGNEYGDNPGGVVYRMTIFR